jgi:hypothetical protein
VAGFPHSRGTYPQEAGKPGALLVGQRRKIGDCLLDGRGKPGLSKVAPSFFDVVGVATTGSDSDTRTCPGYIWGNRDGHDEPRLRFATCPVLLDAFGVSRRGLPKLLV